MADDTYYLQLRRQVETLWPTGIFPLPDMAILDQIWIRAADAIADQDHVAFTSGLLFDQTLEVGLPALDAVSISLGDPAAGVEVGITIQVLPEFSATIGPVDLVVNVRSDLLRPVNRIDTTSPPTFEVIDGARLSVPVASIEATFDLSGSITIESNYSISLPPVMIGSTGIVVEADNLRLVLSEHDAIAIGGNIPPEARGLYVDRAKVYLPQGLSVAVPNDITTEHCLIGPAGISGRFTGQWTPVLSSDRTHFEDSGNVLGVPFGLESIAIELVDNVPIEARIAGQIILPYFDEVVAVTVDIAMDGSFMVSIRATDADGIVVRRDELLELKLRSLSIGTVDNAAGVTLSGGLSPLLMASDGLVWPQLDVTDLSIDSNGKFSIKEAWLDLKDLASLDLWGFHFELRRIGIGSEERDSGDRLWVDLSGGLRLIEQIPVGLDVEGFRLTWPQNLLQNLTGPPTLDQIRDAVSQIEVEFAGVYLFFGVPDAIEFEGLIRFFKDAQVVGFAGDMALRVPASGFGAEAGLLIGLSFAPPFPFLYVYFGVDLPAGIPLGQSGLALKGAQGMFGLNVAPDKTPEQNWYYDWYKRGPIVGAHPTNKWRPEQNALALGVGVTITTTDGYVKGTRGLIVLAVPGPILIIEGRALILNGLQPDAEPPLRALAVFDGGAHTVQFNVEAEATLIADLLKAHGMLEAFFDFNDLTNWRLYLGQDTPRDRRIRADILKLDNSFLFKADAYLMLDMVGSGTLRSRMGVSIEFEPDVPKIDPLEIDFAATLSGDGLVTARPEQFSGEVDLSAHIGLSTFGVSVRLSADARFLTEGPRPLKVGAHVKVKADMPDPLEPFEATLEFEWEAPRVPPVESPLSEIAVGHRFSSAGAGFSKNAAADDHKIFNVASVAAQWKATAEKSPVVPVDSQPIISFEQKMNSTIESFARHPSGDTHHYDVGLFYFEPALIKIDLYEHLKSDDDWSGDPWTLIASTDPNKHKPMPGVWLAESEPETPEAPTPRRVQLWTDNPLSSSSRALGSGYSQFRGAIQPGKSLAERLLDDYPDLMQCVHTKAETVCVNFKAAGKMVIDRGESWDYKNLRFDAPTRAFNVRDACLFVDGYIDIHFRQRIKTLRIVFCQPSKLSTPEVRVRVSTRRGSRSLKELNDPKRKVITLADLHACNVAVDYKLTRLGEDWLLEADEGFDCLHIVRMDEFAIRELCYTTVAEVERSQLAERECKNNSNLPDDGQTLRPGAYYRLDVSTSVTGELHLEDLPFSRHSAIGEMVVAAYNQLVEQLTGGADQLDRQFQQTCLFQTEAPPANLRPYVKWCSPAHQAERFFYGDNIALRFVRSNMKKMFVEPFKLTIQVRDVKGRLVNGYRTKWLRARSATLFAEERVWQDYGRTLNWSGPANPNDDVLVAERARTEQPLQPGSRYQLEIVSAENTEPLFSSTFVTSRFADFEELIDSYGGEPQVVNLKTALGSVAAIQRSARLLARARWAWQRAEIDYAFELLKDGRKGLEQARLARREAEATHDANFRALAETLADLYFRPVSDNLELYLLRDPRFKAVAGVWIRSPESLDLRLPVLADPANSLSTRIDVIGRTEISLQNRNAPSAANSILTFHNAGSDQVLLVPTPGLRWRPGDYAFMLTYHRDYGDETRAIDHRYDRPVEHFGGNIQPESHLLKWSWAG